MFSLKQFLHRAPMRRRGFVQARSRKQPRSGPVRAGARRVLGALYLVLPLALGACAAPWQRVSVGQDVSQLTSTLGPPKETYALPNGGKRLFWPTQPMGETTTAAEVDASGHVVSIGQVLTNESFAQAQIGTWTRADVLSHFGHPFETSYFPLMKRQVWSYRYMDSDVWYMIYNFYFDDAGILRTMQKSPDPLHDPDSRNFPF